MSNQSYFDAMNYDKMILEYGRPEQFESEIARMPRDRLHALQNDRFLRVVAFAWEDPLLSAALGRGWDYARRHSVHRGYWQAATLFERRPDG